MKRTLSVLLALATVLCLVATPAQAAPPRGAAACAASLDCPAEELNQLTMAERLDFVHALTTGPAAAVIPGYTGRWGNIEGIIAFFEDRSMGGTGTWVSYVDAGILEGMERGVALASGRGTDTFGNPGSALWASYLTRLAAGQLRARSAHDLAWSQAEQASTDHGVVLAEQVHGVPATAVEKRFFEFSEFYRFTLRNRSALLDPFSPGPGPGPQRQLTFLDWFTDVANPTPSRHGAELAYSLAEFDLPAGAVRGAAILAAYGKALLDDYLAETR
ncbi:hypothetical protein [Amycolatopsis sp. H20-H5]|uniref:hypothetical protein n=1 Tax=Amycolatopsis sp. H20-H5 TaxID=3046309 RepID=UPI002DBD3DA7|nr:hypothetical protein [Amycolatopsis sp. H20-H5]MEC3982339.1 hypothetical protein [Amycolatopsis sp. H20-H5]